MQPESLNTIREKYLAFFESKGHLRLPSFSLVPRNDPSILLINAGMTPLKPFFTGKEVPPAPRVTTCQKCIRTPDIERVGKTARHGTYFEMLGNFSFGDYFKKEIIPWAWSFCTEILNMPAEKLYVSVYQEDDEAYDIWRRDVGLAADRIYRMGKEDNFWEHGTGPCGPCSEIYFDRGPAYGCGSEGCHVGCDCDRYVEFWNLVFTQFNREEDGTYTPLAKKNIDTGAGLERLACIMQDVDNLFEVDTIRAILDHACRLAGVAYGRDDKTDTAIRVITDHIRSTTMMISDGIIPSNEGRGYVLRRLLRRAARFGRMLGLSRPFLFEITPTVIAESAGAYPELPDQAGRITQIIRREEERFAETIQQGSLILDDIISAARKDSRTVLEGAAVFRLHDTYGFPLDLTREIAAEQGLSIDEAGFQAEMARQKETARQALRARAGSAWGQATLPDAVDRSQATLFTGYDTLEDDGVVLYLVASDDQSMPVLLTEAEAGTVVTVITDRTPFYAAAGGQVGDIGSIGMDQTRLTVQDTTKSVEGIYFHLSLVEEGSIRVGDTVRLQVDQAARLATARNHTTTHLLHKALKLVVGDHVAQAGSAVSPERLRFDFSHFQPLTQAEKQKVEALVNEEILRNDPVVTETKTIDQARQEGAVALFDEKYGETVRVVSVGGFSKELCGGTHLKLSAEACQFRLISESGIASGIRRIEGVTGSAAWLLTREQDQLLQESAAILRVQENELPGRLGQLIDRVKRLEKELADEHKVKLAAAADNLTEQVVVIGAIPTLVTAIQVADAAQLRAAADRIRDRLDDYMIVLGAAIDGKAAWVAMASDKAVQAGLHAGNLIREAARLTGGGGGGKPEMAQAGGKKPELIPQALQELKKLLQEKLRGC
jgi:alanyl-tRNA synthetase